MLLGLYILLIITCLALIALCWVNDTGDGRGIVLSFFLFIGVLFLISCLFFCRNQDINEESRKYYSITELKLENGEITQVVITEDANIKKLTDIGKKSVFYPNDTIICKYNLLPEKGLVHWQNEHVNHYEIIDKDNPLYEKAKNNIRKITNN